ncbi:hypothetical protein [Halobacteriovorax sp. CON-3]|uniref:hypothetical protein n=1 Tax=Halobacteriovorax sp. CON-3 TaxID=3157710 RepID=UPI003713CA61
MRFVLEGIYDKRGFKFANEMAKGAYGFDFRPRSFNFIQGYVVEELLRESLLKLEDIVELHFENDSPIVIDSVIEQVSKIHPNIRVNYGQSGLHTKEELERAGRPFSIIFDITDSQVYEKIQSHLCQSVVFSYEDIHRMSDQGQLNAFIVNFYTKVMATKNEKFELGVKLNWNSNLSIGIIEQLDPDYLKYEISSQVERCYRNIDVPKLSEYFGATIKALAI